MLWKHVQIMRDGPSCTPRYLRTVEGVVVSSPVEQLQVMSTFWSGVTDADQHATVTKFDEEVWKNMKDKARSLPVVDDPEFANSVDVERTKTALDKVSRRKAPGVDGVLDWMLVFGRDSRAFLDSLSALFQAM